MLTQDLGDRKMNGRSLNTGSVKIVCTILCMYFFMLNLFCMGFLSVVKVKYLLNKTTDLP